MPLHAWAQLISPGKLSTFHADLEGIKNCTQCHTLGKPGVDNVRCLSCHKPLEKRIASGKGFHATVSDRNCAECHTEHLGINFDPVKFDTLSFKHGEKTSFKLLGAHTTIFCRDCHTPSLIQDKEVISFKSKHPKGLQRTFLGLDTTCDACHQADNPHQDQFRDVSCATCHTEETWKKAPRFDHNQTRFPLTGAHRNVDCSSCHLRETLAGGLTFVRYRGIDFTSCASCHEDVHRGAFGTNCQSCHNTSDWHRVRVNRTRFNHDATGFPLTGAHATLSCASCHGKPPRQDETIYIRYQKGTEKNTYPEPVVENCLSCHRDYHRGTFASFPGGPNCANCHSEKAWTPSTFDLERHNRETNFPLLGAHASLSCQSCHKENEKLNFVFASTECLTCHEKDNPHGDQFEGQSCANCHSEKAWKPPSRFDHNRTRFPLTGAHAELSCQSCHKEEVGPDGKRIIRYRPLGTRCIDCHG